MDFSGRRVLVSGGGGFIGGHLARELARQGAQVRILDDFRYGGRSASDFTEVFEGDVCSEKLAGEAMGDVDLVYHLAAMPFIPSCDRHPHETRRVNVEGTRVMLDAAFCEGVDSFVYASSAEVYGPAQSPRMGEDHPINPMSLYAETKVAAEELVREYAGKGLSTVIIRLFNTFGPGDTHPRIIPELFTQLSKSNQLKLGNLDVSRDFVYVADAVDAFLAAAGKDAVGGVFNIGTGVETKLNGLVGEIAGLMGVSNYEITVEDGRVRKPDVARLCADPSKAARVLGWRPKVRLREGLKETIEWFRESGGFDFG